MSAITMKDIHYQYPNAKQPIIDGLSLSFPQNKWTGIIGYNGSGKSTIVRLIDGLLIPQHGSITVNGLTVSEDHLSQIHQQIGIVFQNPDNQFVGATVADDVAFGLENRQIPPLKMKEIVPRVLAEVGMSKYAHTEPASLSGGQKQRVAIAGILALQPKIMILDEATSMLDPAGRQSILKLLVQLRKKYQLTIISITHDPHEMEMTDQLVVIEHGQVVTQGPTKAVLNHGDLLRKAGVGSPVSSRLLKLLKDRGIKTPERYLTTEEMVDWLWQQFQ